MGIQEETDNQPIGRSHTKSVTKAVKSAPKKVAVKSEPKKVAVKGAPKKAK
jgi:hypothetical protein